MSSLDLLLPRSFYTRNTLNVAKELLGKHLVRRISKEELAGKIVEVEAYRGSDDPASHASRGVTPRSRLMFGKGGVAYIYFIYGKHFCLNVTTGKEGVPGAVLIRALEPVSGIGKMKRHRGVESLRELANGPGKLTEAMRVTTQQNGLDLTKSKRLFICKPRTEESFEIVSTQRIRIRIGVDKRWRFYMKGNNFVSRK
jgi:DNA-3-methyladenine glycosylase